MIGQDIKAYNWVRTLFKDKEGKPFEMTPGQIEIFRTIYEKQTPRVQIEAYTGYGKSDIISMAILSRASTFPERWALIGGTKDKAAIIMGYVIKHIFENEYTLSKFKIGRDESLERIKRERSKDRLTFRIMKEKDQVGEIFILSGEARRATEDAGDILIGYHSPNIIQDDSSLIPNLIHGKMMRMLDGMEGTFLAKVGNPMRRNHFLRSHNSPKYKKITIDYRQGIEEGRTTQEYIEEMRKEMDPINFSMFYECKFPPEEMIEEGGWMRLLLDEEIDRSFIKEMPYVVGEMRLGIDVARGGGNYSTIIFRCDNFAQVVFRSATIKPLELAIKAMEIRDKIIRTYPGAYLRLGEMRRPICLVDALGPGAKTYGKMKEHIPDFVIGVMAGDPATDKKTFFNKRAEMYWRAREWLLGGGKLVEHQGWDELRSIKYKAHYDRRIKIMSKEEMMREGIASPDVADGWANSFAAAPIARVEENLYPQVKELREGDFDVY